MPKLFDVTIFGTIKTKICKVPAEGMREAVEKAKEECDVDVVNDVLAKHVRHQSVEVADDEEPRYGVEAAGNDDKRHPEDVVMFAESGDKLVKIPSGPNARLGDLHRFIQRIAALKTEEEQDIDGNDFSNDEHVSNMDQVIVEARVILGKSDGHGANVSW